MNWKRIKEKKRKDKWKERNNKDWKINKKGLYPCLNEKHAIYQKLKKKNYPFWFAVNHEWKIKNPANDKWLFKESLFVLSTAQQLWKGNTFEISMFVISKYNYLISRLTKSGISPH